MMIPIQHSLKSFTQHLEQNISISCSATGWKPDGFIGRLKNRIYDWLHWTSDARLESIGKCFSSAIESLEHRPVLFNLNAQNQLEQQQFYAEYLKASKLVKKLLKNSKSIKVCNQLNNLAIKVAALKYRIEACNGGLNPVTEVHEVLHDQVKNAVLTWKKDQRLSVDHRLCKRDLNKIEEVCSYPKFAKLLLSNIQLKEAFFKWALRDNNGVGQFVQFPEICNRLKTSYIAPRLGYFCGGEALTLAKIQKAGLLLNLNTQEKVLQLPFYDGIKTEKISILDETREITLNEGWKVSIKKIFDVFANKNNQPGNIEFLGVNGIMNWNTRKLSPWNPQINSFSLIDFNDPQWIKKLPLSEVKSQDELNKRYGISITPGKWLFIYRAARDVADLSLTGRHGFLEIAMPTQDGNYAIYPFGDYPDQFPVGIIASLVSINATSPSSIVYPDDNINYPHREHAMMAKEISSDEGLLALELIRQDLQKSQTKNKIFQSRKENCSYWVQKISEKIESCKTINPFKIEIIQSHMFVFIGKLPKICQRIFIAALDVLLGEHRGMIVEENGQKVFKSVSLIPSNEKRFMYQPGWLHEQIKSGLLPGRIYSGHC